MGCAVSSPDAPDAEPIATTATAIVVIERSAGPTELVRENVVARFVRVRQGAVDDSALRMAGVVQDLPPVGTCAAPSELTWTAGANLPRAVDLLDVGPLAVESQGRTTTLHARSMPDPAGVVSGVFYSAPASSSAASAAPFAPGDKLVVRANGGPDLEGFTATVNVPRDPGDVRVTLGTSGLGGLEVAWEPDSESDVVYVDVVPAGSHGHALVRCTSADVGHLVVPGFALAGVDEANVAVHRLHRETFRAKGIDPGEARFDVARIVTFRRP